MKVTFDRIAFLSSMVLPLTFNFQFLLIFLLPEVLFRFVPPRSAYNGSWVTPRSTILISPIAKSVTAMEIIFANFYAHFAAYIYCHLKAIFSDTFSNLRNIIYSEVFMPSMLIVGVCCKKVSVLPCFDLIDLGFKLSILCF